MTLRRPDSFDEGFVVTNKFGAYVALNPSILSFGKTGQSGQFALPFP